MHVGTLGLPGLIATDQGESDAATVCMVSSCMTRAGTACGVVAAWRGVAMHVSGCACKSDRVAYAGPQLQPSEWQVRQVAGHVSANLQEMCNMPKHTVRSCWEAHCSHYEVGDASRLACLDFLKSSCYTTTAEVVCFGAPSGTPGIATIGAL